VSATPPASVTAYDRDLGGRVAIVTGGTRGIGRAIVEELSAAGCRLVVNCRVSRNAARALVAEIEARGGEAIVGHASIAEEGAGEVLVHRAMQTWGRVDILVNNAGINRDATIRKMTDTQLLEVIETNLVGTHRVTRAVLEPMCASGYGRVITIASSVARTGAVGQTNYAATKAGLIGWTKALALEVARFGVTANCVAPGLVETDALAAVPEDVRAKLVAQVPLGRFARPEEIARAVRFLAEAGYCTGSCVDINGGISM
jgi:NAD(P)-dependent dehydrogenase (short-subunit alcohol dehydrogenase family)